MTNRAKLANGSIAGHLFKQTIPGIIGVGAIMSVGIVDAYFIGQLGQAELAAISFIFPIITALASLGVGVMVGVNSVVARAIGSGDASDATACGTMGVLIGFAVGLVVGGLLYALRIPLFSLMQADAQILPLIDLYMQPYAIGFPLLLGTMGMNGVLRGQGAATSSTLVLISFSLVNLALDPFLIAGGFGMPGLGMAGAAYATIGGWAIGNITGFYMVARGSVPFQLSALNRDQIGPSLRRIARVAIPASLTSSINPAGLAVLTAFLASYGQAAVAGFGAGGRIQTIALVPLLALSGSIGAIVGQNWGAGQYDRAKLALVQSLCFCLAYGLLAALILFSMRAEFAAIFSNDIEAKTATIEYLSYSVWGYAGFGILVTVNGALNAVDGARYALVLSLTRVALVMVPAALLLQNLWGRSAIYTGELAANLFGGVLALLIAIWVFRKATGEKAG